MTEEEKKAIEIVKGLAVYYDDYSLLDEEEIEENESVNKSIELILNLIEKLLKENESLKENNMEYKRILDLADNRIYRKKYLEERRKEELNLLYPDSDEIYQIYYELKQENEKVIFPALLIGLNGKHEIENLIEEYLLIEQNDDENSLLRNEYGKLVEQKLNISGWTVLDKFRRIKEEDFYVYGYHPRWGRKTFQWIYDNIVTANINSKYDFKRVCMLLNKIVIKDDNNNMNLIICKSDSDAARFYNLLEQWVKKNKEKQILMVGDYTPVGSRRKKLEEEIMALTGWPIKKVQMRFTTFYKSEKNKKKKLNEEKANNNETNVEHDESIEQDI